MIFSRDLSWANEDDIKRVLIEKSERGELTVCLEKENTLSKQLKANGAKIITYSDLGHIPRSRFTIMDFGKDGARVAVGAKTGNRHLIQEFRDGSHPCFAVADDLVRILVAATENSK